jgi:hypothetical protein
MESMKAPCMRIAVALALAACGCRFVSGISPEETLRQQGLWQSHTEAGLVAARRGSLEEAERELLTAIASLTSIPGNETRLIRSLNHLAHLYSKGARPAHAERVLRKAMDLAEKTVGAEHPEAIQTLSALDDLQTPAIIPTACQYSPGAAQRPPQDEKATERTPQEDFPLNINLWPLFESRTLSTGERRNSLLLLFHVTTAPNGEVHSWHVLNVISGPDYFVLVPLYYRAGAEGGAYSGFLPPLFLQGPRSWMVPPLLTASWKHSDGSRSTWVTPLFHLTADKDGVAESLHLAPVYFWERDQYWFIPLALTGSWSTATGGHRTWVTPLFHVTTDRNGTVEGWHVGPYFSGPGYWAILPLLTASWTTEDGGRSTWITPLFHQTRDRNGELSSFHAGPYFQGPGYWAVPPFLTGSWRREEGGAATWVTPLFHLTSDKDGAAESVHVGPLYFWERDHYWIIPPALTASWATGEGGRTTWVTPLFHVARNKAGRLESLHVGPYLEGPGYWAVPPLLTGSWTYVDGGRTTWVTPLYHSTTDPQGRLASLHVGPFFHGPGYWAVPPLLTGSWRRSDGGTTTWITPLFHLSSDAGGRAESAHLAPFYFWERDRFWFVLPAFTGTWSHKEGGQSTWVTPLFHLTSDKEGVAESLHVAPVYFWERDSYWVVPPILAAGGRHDDGGWSTWITPLFHRTTDKGGDAESLHLAPLFLWKRDSFWLAPPILAGGLTHGDGSRSTWVTPLFHSTTDREGRLVSLHAGPYVQGDDFRFLVPVYWEWTDALKTRRSIVPLLFTRTAEPDGDVTTSVLWPFFSHFSGKELDTSLGMQLQPFVYQTAGDDYELNFLWRLVHLRRQGTVATTMVGPLWWSERPKDGVPAEFQVLGGLVARDCNYDKGLYRYRILWIIPLGSQPIEVDTLSMFGLTPVFASAF